MHVYIYIYVCLYHKYIYVNNYIFICIYMYINIIYIHQNTHGVLFLNCSWSIVYNGADICEKNLRTKTYINEKRTAKYFSIKVGLGIFSNERGFSVESSLQRISSIFFVVETKRFVGSFVNVILTWQTCGQRSSRAAESKRRALQNYLSERICHMFLMSKCRKDQDLGLCKFWVLAKR